jgi:ABC-type polysaccharide/polyol phosphate export permease
MDLATVTLIGVPLIAALCGHIFIRRFIIVCCLSVGAQVIAGTALLIMDMQRRGLPPAKLFYAPLILALPAAFALGIAVVIGLPFHFYRRSKIPPKLTTALHLTPR